MSEPISEEPRVACAVLLGLPYLLRKEPRVETVPFDKSGALTKGDLQVGEFRVLEGEEKLAGGWDVIQSGVSFRAALSL